MRLEPYPISMWILLLAAFLSLWINTTVWIATHSTQKAIQETISETKLSLGKTENESSEGELIQMPDTSAIESPMPYALNGETPIEKNLIQSSIHSEETKTNTTEINQPISESEPKRDSWLALEMINPATETNETKSDGIQYKKDGDRQFIPIQITWHSVQQLEEVVKAFGGFIVGVNSQDKIITCIQGFLNKEPVVNPKKIDWSRFSEQYFPCPHEYYSIISEVIPSWEKASIHSFIILFPHNTDRHIYNEIITKVQNEKPHPKPIRLAKGCFKKTKGIYKFYVTDIQFQP